MSVEPGTITAITPQRRRADRINVFIDGTFAFGLAASAAHELRVGDDLSVADIQRLEALDNLAETKRRAVNYVMNRPRSVVEMERYLRRKKVPDAVAQQVIDYLNQHGHLDDAAFCRYWIEQRELFKPRSAYALRRELQAKGVDGRVIDHALQDFDNEQAAMAAAEKRAHRWAHLPQAEFEVKMGRYLQRRGFRYGIIRDIMDRVWAAHAHADGER